MSFLGPLFAGGGASAAASTANGAAGGLGRLIGQDPSRISQVAAQIGQGANGIATAGGAAPGYGGPAPQAAEAPVANHMQLADPNFIQTLMRQFGGYPQ